MTMMEEVVCVAAATPTPTACSKAGDVEETEARTEVRAAHDTGEWDGGQGATTRTPTHTQPHSQSALRVKHTMHRPMEGIPLPCRSCLARTWDRRCRWHARRLLLPSSNPPHTRCTVTEGVAAVNRRQKSTRASHRGDTTVPHSASDRVTALRDASDKVCAWANVRPRPPARGSGPGALPSSTRCRMYPASITT